MTANAKRPTSVPTQLLDRIAMRAALAMFGIVPAHNVNGATLRTLLDKAQAYESMRVAALIEDGDREIAKRRASNLSAGARKAWDTRRARSQAQTDLASPGWVARAEGQAQLDAENHASSVLSATESSADVRARLCIVG